MGQLALGGAALAVPVTAAAAEPDPHLAWEREERQLAAAISIAVNGGDEDRAEELNAARCALRERITRTPAAPPAGAAVQLRHVVSDYEEEGLMIEGEQLRAVALAAAMLDGIAAGRAPA